MKVHAREQNIMNLRNYRINLLNLAAYISSMVAECVMVTKEAISDLVRVKDEFDTIVESLELMSDTEFMDSYKKARQQIANREFVDWNEL